MPIFKQIGDFSKTTKMLINFQKANVRPILDRYGQMGVAALSAYTPRDSGLTADSWDYKVVTAKTGFKLIWTNASMAGGTPVVILIQYGHGTRNGGYVPPLDFINVAMKPLLDEIAANIWKELSVS